MSPVGERWRYIGTGSAYCALFYSKYDLALFVSRQIKGLRSCNISHPPVSNPSREIDKKSRERKSTVSGRGQRAGGEALIMNRLTCPDLCRRREAVKLILTFSTNTRVSLVWNPVRWILWEYMVIPSLVFILPSLAYFPFVSIPPTENERAKCKEKTHDKDVFTSEASSSEKTSVWYDAGTAGSPVSQRQPQIMWLWHGAHYHCLCFSCVIDVLLYCMANHSYM